ncbi:MAG: hypothetical protein D6732_18820 [Methanobacteriota archaeon]|nr:MAG: hypothetical protein D6732_18820 [Euryarchaeota archaeon]
MSKLPDLSSLLSFWLPILKLTNWDITAKYVSHASMPDGDTMGHISIWENYLRAEIKILHPRDYRGELPFDIEQVLLHELIHIWTNEVKNGDTKEEERVCESLSWALLNLWRNHGKDKFRKSF